MLLKFKILLIDTKNLLVFDPYSFNGWSFLRIIIQIRSKNFRRPINKHAIQGFIYRMMRNTEFDSIHDYPYFKYFSFSDDFVDRYGNLSFLISSPSKEFITTLASKIREQESIMIGNQKFSNFKVKVFSSHLSDTFTTGSPIVIYEDSRLNRYFSFRRNGDIRFFLDRLKENVLKKYNAYYNTNLDFNEDIFDSLKSDEKRVDVVVNVQKDNSKFIIIGTVWDELIKSNVFEHSHLYRFIMDCGLGEKNSLGFGFVNTKRS